MNKKLFFTVIIAFLLVGFYSCHKDENTEIPNLQKISQEDLDVAQKITSFIDKINNPSTLKSGELIEIDEALWSLEAAMNYQFANVPEHFDDVMVDSVKLTIPINEDYCSVSDVVLFYQKVYTLAQAASNSDDRNLIAISSSLSTIEGDEASVSIRFFETSVVTDPPNYPHVYPDLYGGFHQDDWWYAGGKNGICSGPYYTWFDEPDGIGRNAATELKRKANQYVPLLGAVNGKVYFTDIELVFLEPGNFRNPSWHYNDDPLFEYLIYYGPRTHNTCLSPTLMNFYLSNLVSLAKTTLKPSGKTLISIPLFFYDYSVGSDDRDTRSFEAHLGEVQYGVPHIKPDPLQM